MGGELLPVKCEWLPAEAFGIVLIGPSGVGKSTLAEELQGCGLVKVLPTWATRRRRSVEREKPPCDHRFVAPNLFDNGDLLITRSLYGFKYGIPRLRRPQGAQLPLLVLKPDFIEELLGYFPNLRIYQIEASPTILFERMRLRGQSEADIGKRMREYEPEIAAGRHFAHSLFNNDGELRQTLHRLTEQIHLDMALYHEDFAYPIFDAPTMLQ